MADDKVLQKYYRQRLKILDEVAAEHLDVYNKCIEEKGHIKEKLIGWDILWYFNRTL